MMGKHLSLAFALSVLVMGCASDDPGGGGDDDPQVSPLGRYAVRSEISIQAPPVVTAAAASFYDAAFDSPGWLCTTTASQISDAGIRAMVEAGCSNGVLHQLINDHLIQIAPGLTTAFLKLNEGLPKVASAFGVGSELRIEAHDAGFLANHRVSEIAFGERVFALLDFGIGINIETDIDIAWSTPQLGIAQHHIPVPVGTAIRIGFVKIVLPTIDGAATGLADLYDRQVDCSELGQVIFDTIGQGSAVMFTAACDAGLAATGGAFDQQLEDLDNKLDLRIASTAEAQDVDGDARVDRITGSWTGAVLEQLKPPGPLSATLFAERL